jgi:threonine dehydratase
VITFADIEAARRTIAGSVQLTPCTYSELLSRAVGSKLWLKLENLQMTGSFKERGACNKLASLDGPSKARGVICASAGNHAQGVAYHASRLGIDAKIVMPEGTPLVKVARTKSFGGQVVLVGSHFDEALAHAHELERVEGRVFIHGFDDDLVIAGQGTIGLELVEQNPFLDAVVVAVGGGGLIGGIAMAIKETNPKIKVYGVESTAVPSMRAALDAKGPVDVPAQRSIADGIAIRRVGERPYELVTRYVDDVVTVDEEEIAESILMLLEMEKTVAEGAGAAPLAAMVHGRLPLAGKKVCAVVCGGNIDVNFISRIIERGLVKSGRLVQFEVTIPDVSGGLARLARIIADTKASVVQLRHERAFAQSTFDEVVVEVVLETRGFDHVREVEAAIVRAGYPLRLAMT